MYCLYIHVAYDACHDSGAQFRQNRVEESIRKYSPCVHLDTRELEMFTVDLIL